MNSLVILWGVHALYCLVMFLWNSVLWVINTISPSEEELIQQAAAAINGYAAHGYFAALIVSLSIGALLLAVKFIVKQIDIVVHNNRVKISIPNRK